MLDKKKLIDLPQVTFPSLPLWSGKKYEHHSELLDLALHADLSSKRLLPAIPLHISAPISSQSYLNYPL